MSRKKDKYNVYLMSYILLTVAVYAVFRGFPVLADIFYGQLIYAPLRLAFDGTIGHLEFPALYLVLITLILLVGFLIKSTDRRGIPRMLFSGLVIMVGLFFWAWGYNYMRPNVKQRLSLEIPKPDVQVLEDMFCEMVDSMPVWRARADTTRDFAMLEKEVRRVTHHFFQMNELPAPGNPRIRKLYPKGVLLGTSTAGIFIPWAFEAHFDAGLHPLVWPHVMAHELSHAYGVTDEGECNFIASVACYESDIAAFQYSGALHDLRYVFGALIRAGLNEEFLKSQIDPLILSDLKSIRVRHDSYPEYVPVSWRNWIYDRYLRSQGVNSGLNSYGEVLGLLVSWRQRSEE